MKYSELAKKLETATSETRNLIVRPFRNSDEDGLLELFRDQNTMHMDGDTPILEKNDEFIRRINLIKEGPLIWLFSEEKKSSDFVGYIMLQDEGDAIALGFALTASKQYMGYGVIYLMHKVKNTQVLLKEDKQKQIGILDNINYG